MLTTLGGGTLLQFDLTGQGRSDLELVLSGEVRVTLDDFIL